MSKNHILENETLKNDFKLKFRYMLPDQLSEEFNLSMQDINWLIGKLSLKMKDIIDKLSDEEVILMYKGILEGKRKTFSNGIGKHERYIKVIFRYLIFEVLKWSRNDICNNFSNKTLTEYKLAGFNSYGVHDLIEKFLPEFNIKRWELKKSSVGRFWNKQDNIDNALNWLKDCLAKRGINNIYDVAKYGFYKTIEKYNLSGLCNVSFKSSAIRLFERVYDFQYDKSELLETNYSFDINEEVVVSDNLNGKVYLLTDKYKKLDSIGKRLIDEVIRFCEENKSFPDEKELTKKKGYISRTQFYKYFKETSFNKVYDYIIPFNRTLTGNKKASIIQKNISKPKEQRCTKCGVIKEFNEVNFMSNKSHKYGLMITCRECVNKYTKELEYKRRGLEYEEREDISPVQWWEYLREGKIGLLPDFCLTEQNMIKIIKYVITEKMKLKTKTEICSGFKANNYFLRSFSIQHLYLRFSGKLEILQKCFPELNITEVDLPIISYNEDIMESIIDNWISENNVTVNHILNSGISTEFDDEMYNLCAVKFGSSKTKLFMWYFKYKKINHPSRNREIFDIDFKYHSNKFWDDEDRRILKIRDYCESKYIRDSLISTTALKEWIYKHFTQGKVVKNLYEYHKYHSSLYDMITFAYPEIIENKILFEWEWHQSNNSSKEFLAQAMRQFILYRLNNFITNIKEDVPNYINHQFINAIFPRFNKHIFRKRFRNYYEWCVEAFPEYKDTWKEEDFGLIIASDGEILGSKEEKLIYEYCKYQLGLNIKSIGSKRKGKYVYKLQKESKDSFYCPDFVIEGTNDLPIIIEYYGMYSETHTHEIFVKYKMKTKRKNKYYNSLSDIVFIDLYPEDLKNELQGVREKLAPCIKQSQLT